MTKAPRRGVPVAAPAVEESADDDPEGDWRDVFDSLRKFRDIAISGEIRLSDIEVTVLAEDQTRQIALASLRHAAGSGVFQIEGFFPGKLLPKPPPVQDFILDWNENEIVLNTGSTMGLNLVAYAIPGSLLDFSSLAPLLLRL